MKMRVTFVYEANEDDYGDQNSPREIAEQDSKMIEEGEIDISDLFDEVSVETIKIVPV